MLEWIDAHCHWPHSRFGTDPGLLIRRAVAAGVRRLVCCAVEPQGWDSIAALADAYPRQVVPAFGVHPWFVESLPPDWERRLIAYLARPGSLVGEIGLDAMPGRPPVVLQRRVLQRQIEIAREHRRPMVLHCVRADDMLASLLASDRNGIAGDVLVHGVSGSPDRVARMVGWGGYISVSGAILDPRRRKARQVASAIPDERLMIETDAPFGVTSQRGGQVEPADIPFIAATLAGLRQTTPEHLSTLTITNTRRWLNEASQPSPRRASPATQRSEIRGQKSDVSKRNPCHDRCPDRCSDRYQKTDLCPLTSCPICP